MASATERKQQRKGQTMNNTMSAAIEARDQIRHTTFEYLRTVFDAQIKHRDNRVLFNAFNQQYIKCYSDLDGLLAK